MTDTPQQAAVSPMAMAIAESAARQFFERQYILTLEKNVQLNLRLEGAESRPSLALQERLRRSAVRQEPFWLH